MLKRRPIPSIATALLLASPAAFGSATKIPISLYGGYTIVARGSAGRLHNLNFIVDTGAVPSVIDWSVARKLHLQGPRQQLLVFNKSVQAEQVVMPDIELGPLRAQGVRMLSQDLSPFSTALGVHVDGMVGLDLLSLADFTIDYELRRIDFGARSQAPSATTNAVEVPFEIQPGYVTVVFELQRTPMRLMVDTGASELVLFEDRLAGQMQGINLLSRKVIGNLGGDLKVTRAEVPVARLGGMELRNQRASLMAVASESPTNLDGLLGVVSLGTKRISFDFKRNRIVWER